MATKKPVAKPAAKKPAPKKAAPAPKKATPQKGSTKKSVPAKGGTKKPAPKPVAKKAVAKPKPGTKPANKPVAKPAAKKAPVKAVAKSVNKVVAKKAAPAKNQAKTLKKTETKKAPVAKASVKAATKAPVKPAAKAAPAVKAAPVKAAPVAAKPAVKAPPAKPVVQKPVVLPKIHTKTSRKYEPDFTKSVLDQAPHDPGAPIVMYSDADLTEFRELIQRKLGSAKKELTYLQGLITRKDDMGGDEGDNRYMTMEDGSLSMEREQLSQMASRQITFIDHLEKALMRIENKTYGICRITGKLIDKARLRAVPHATLSIEAKMSGK
jgi:RNA polymerase-binding transcription factor DksA